MDYGGANFEHERHITDFFNYICSKNVSKVASVIVAFSYSFATVLSACIDTSAFYDAIGFTTVFILVCSQISFVGGHIRSLAHVVIILAWCFTQLILTGVYWQSDDRRFKDNYFSSEISRLILFFGQGLQLTLLLWTTFLMIHKRRAYEKFAKKHYPPLVSKIAWILTAIGFIISCVFFQQLKIKDEQAWHWHYGGEILFWLGLNLSALSALPNRYHSNLLLAAPLCFFIPYWTFN